MWNHHCQQVAQRLDQMVQVQNQDVSGQSLHWNRKIQPEKTQYILRSFGSLPEMICHLPGWLHRCRDRRRALHWKGLHDSRINKSGKLKTREL